MVDRNIFAYLKFTNGRYARFTFSKIGYVGSLALPQYSMARGIYALSDSFRPVSM